MKRTIRLTESDLHKAIKNIISEAIGDAAGPVFPNNLKGTSAKFVENSDDVFICGDYHGRYEDDDCEFLVYNIPTRKFRVLGWTTRAYCSGESPFNTEVINVNKVDGALQQEITEAAKEEAKANPEKIIRSLVSILKNRYPKSYSQKTLNQAIEAIQNTLTATIDSVTELPVAISLIYNSPYSGYDMSGYFSKFCDMALQNCGVEIKSSLNRKPQRVKLQGDDYTGQVVSVRFIDTRFGKACKVGILPDGGSKSVWAIINPKQTPEKGEVITLNGTIGNETEKSITLYSAKRIDKIDPSLIDRLSESVFHRIVSETVRKVLREGIEEAPQLWAEIRFVQGGEEDYDEIFDMFCGEENRGTAYCGGYSQPVIDYLKDWDSDENNLVTEKPRIARYDSEYADENGEYTLLYNGGVGGCFLLYRPANEQEIDWYMNQR